MLISTKISYWFILYGTYTCVFYQFIVAGKYQNLFGEEEAARITLTKLQLLQS